MTKVRALNAYGKIRVVRCVPPRVSVCCVLDPSQATRKKGREKLKKKQKNNNNLKKQNKRTQITKILPVLVVPRL